MKGALSFTMWWIFPRTILCDYSNDATLLSYFEIGIHYELWLSRLSRLSIFKYNAVLSIICMRGKDSWMKKVFYTETEASSDLEDRGGEGGYRTWNSSKVWSHVRLLVNLCDWNCVSYMHVCMRSLASSVQAVQAEIYRVRSFWPCPGPGDRSLHIARQPTPALFNAPESSARSDSGGSVLPQIQWPTAALC